MQDCWVFDVDGTLSDTTNRQQYVTSKPKRWDLWNADMANDGYHMDIVQFYQFARDKGMAVVVCTGREEEYRNLTATWLAKVGIMPDRMYMRRNGDFCHDDKMKQVMLEQMRADGFNPVLVFEDRTRVVKMWRANGIRCLQVVNGDF